MYVGQWTEKKGEYRTVGEGKVTKPWKKGKKSALEKKCDTNIINHLKSLPWYKDQTEGRSVASLSVTPSRYCSRRGDSISMRIVSRSTSCQPSLWKVPGCKSCTASSSATTSEWRITRFTVYRLFNFRCDVFDFLCIKCKWRKGTGEGMTHLSMFL